MLECFNLWICIRCASLKWKLATRPKLGSKSWLQKVFYGSAKNKKQEKSEKFLFIFHLRQLKIFTWYWTGARRAQLPRRNELLSRLYQRLLVGDAWGNWRLTIGGSVADFVRCFDWLWTKRRFDEWSSDFDLFVSLGLMSESNWSEFMMAPLSGDFDSIELCFRGGFIEIRDDGGDESNNEKRRNIFKLAFVCYLLWVVNH